jgi:sigma-E factor negative regulatory protein RseA
MTAANRNVETTTEALSEDASLRSAISALVDGELSPAELSSLLDRPGGCSEWHGDWQTYHLIGDVLRGSEPALASRAGKVDFLQALGTRLREEVQPVQTAPTPAVVVRGPAANDAVFRWKLVAGLASLAAVAAVGWSLVAPGGAQVPAGPQLAGTKPAPVVAEAPQAVVVQTPQGQMVRDPRLEQLLSEHRQYGGMSALQMPAGFLRNATYDEAPQR